MRLIYFQYFQKLNNHIEKIKVDDKICKRQWKMFKYIVKNGSNHHAYLLQGVTPILDFIQN